MSVATGERIPADMAIHLPPLRWWDVNVRDDSGVVIFAGEYQGQQRDQVIRNVNDDVAGAGVSLLGLSYVVMPCQHRVAPL